MTQERRPLSLRVLLFGSLLLASILNYLLHSRSITLFHASWIMLMARADEITSAFPLVTRTRFQRSGFNQSRPVLVFPLEEEEEWQHRSRNNTYVDWCALCSVFTLGSQASMPFSAMFAKCTTTGRKRFLCD